MTANTSRLLKAGLAAAVVFAILVGLGSWQLARLVWKTDLVARVTERMAEPPVPAPPRAEWPALDLDRWTYRHVSLEGVFDNSKEARVYANLPDAKGPFRGAGYFILTPLTLNNGQGTVLVNRGFVPLGREDPSMRPAGQLSGDVTVTGALREPETRNMFTPDDVAYKRFFFARDAKAIADGLGLTGVAPFTVDASESAPGGLPQGGETRVSFPNRHLEYALTWYGLAATLAAFFMVFAWRMRGEGEGERHRQEQAVRPCSDHMVRIEDGR